MSRKEYPPAERHDRVLRGKQRARKTGVTPDRLPVSPAEIDAGWLTGALARRHHGCRVAEVTVVEVNEVTNTHTRLRVSYEHPDGAPTELFGKLLPLEPPRRQAIARTGMGRREVLFYDMLASTVRMRVPTVHVALHDDRDGSFVLLIEDLAATGCSVSDGTRGVAPDAAASALLDLADLHLRFRDPGYRAATAGWVPHLTGDSTYGKELLRHGLTHHRDRLSADFAEIAELYIDRSAELQALWRRGPATVIHGDPHIGNLFDDHGRTGFLDWGIINVSTPLRDVSYFLNMSLSVEDRRRHERDLLRHYLDAWTAGGGAAVSFDEAWLTHRLHAAYTVPACCQIVAFPENVTERRRIFAEAFLARAEAALADLEARAALRQAAGW